MPWPLAAEFSKPLLCARLRLSWLVRPVSELIRPVTHCQTLDRHGVDYLTIGAWAVIAHGYVRAPADSDFVARLDRDNMVRLAAALTEWGAKLRGVDADNLGLDPTDLSVPENGASLTMDTDAGPLDFPIDVPGAEDSTRAKLAGGPRSSADRAEDF